MALIRLGHLALFVGLYGLMVIALHFGYVKERIRLMYLHDGNLRSSDQSSLLELSFNGRTIEPAKSLSIVAKTNHTVTVAVAGCAGELNQTFLLLKSIFMSSEAENPVKIYFFTEPEHHSYVTLKFNELARSRAFSVKNMGLQVLSPSYPIFDNATVRNHWQNMWRPCSTQRLFLPDVLLHEDAVIYVDADTRFLGPIQRLWNYFAQMNSSQFMGMAAEHEVDELAYYGSPYNMVPFVEPRGVNSGVLLMNLTRMRQLNFTDRLLTAYAIYKDDLGLHDQDLLNILFYDDPGGLFMLPCAWNYRYHHCMNGTSNCRSAEQEGVHILHGVLASLWSLFESQWEFPVINQGLQEYDPDGDITIEHFRQLLIYALVKLPENNTCRPLYLRGLADWE